MEQHDQPFLAEQKVGGLMARYALPCVISLLVGALYNIVDQIYIANADYLGSYGNAANTVVFPLTVIALAVAVMIGDGCCAFVSLCLGRNEPEDASRSMGNAISLTLVSSLVLMAVYLIFMDPIIAMFGGTVNEQTFHHSREYLFWISLGIPFYMFGQAMNPVIRADGSPRFAMASTLAGAVVNILLDPILIYGWFGCPKMGMAGAAIATVAGQMLTAVLAVWYLFHTRTVKLSLSDMKWKAGVVGRTLSLGICSFLSQIPMAVVGIVMKFFQIVITIVVGMAAGCIPIVGYNMGAGLKHRVKKLLTMLLIWEAAVGVVSFLLVEFFPQGIIRIFGAANESVYYTDFAVRAFRIYLMFIVLACVNKAAFIFLQAMGKAAASTMLSMVREIMFGVGFALILPMFMGLDGVLWSMPASDLLTAVVSAVVLVRTYRELGTRKSV